jgi:hypothetical protein
MGSVIDYSQVEIPTHCKAGVVVNEGSDFHVEVQMVPVPQPGRVPIGVSDIPLCTRSRPLMQMCRPRRCFDQAELYWTLLVRYPYDARRLGSSAYVNVRCAIYGA